MNIIERFKSLPVSSRRLLSIGIIFALVVALPLFIWAIVTQKFLFNQKAASGEPTTTQGVSIDWRTAYVELNADDFYIKTNGQVFTGTPMINIHSDPGSSTYTTLEVIWHENGVEMRMFMYFYGDGQDWWLKEARIYNGQVNGDWVELLANSQSFKTPMGQTYMQNTPGGFVVMDPTTGQPTAELHFSRMNLRAFANRTASGSIPCIRVSPSISSFPHSSGVGPGGSYQFTLVFKNGDQGLCPYSDINLAFEFPSNGWNAASQIGHVYSSPGDTTSFDVNITNPPNTAPNQYYYPIVRTSENGVGVHTSAFTIPYYVSSNAATPTPTPTGASCNGACVNNLSCESGLVCSGGVCRNPSCVSTSSCACSVATPTPTPTGTPPPTVRPFEIRFKFDGVSDNSASDAKVSARFVSRALNSALGVITPPLSIVYEGNGVYKLLVGIWSTDLPSANDYALILKGEKHLGIKFCDVGGQNVHCLGGEPGRITIPTNPLEKVFLDFTNMVLPAGDTYPQDGVVNSSDFDRVTRLLTKPCDQLTDQEKLVGDLDYNGCVNIRDVFLVRKTLETRYDEN